MMYTMPKNLLSICVNFTLATQPRHRYKTRAYRLNWRAEGSPLYGTNLVSAVGRGALPRRMPHLHIVYPPGRAMLAQATLNHTSLGCTLCVPTI